MATFSDKLLLLISADSGPAVKELQKVGVAAETNLGTGGKAAGGQIKGLVTAFQALPPIVQVAAGAFVAFGAIAVKEALAGEASHARLDTAIRNVGQSTKDWTPQIQAAANKMAALGVNNDDVESSIARLIPATHDVKKAIADQAIALDIARARGIDLASATDLLVKVESGHYTQLGRLGIATKDQIKGFKTSQDAVDFLSRTYAGAAATSAKTFSGQMAALSAEGHNFAESVGQQVLPALTSEITTLNRLVQIGSEVDQFTSKAGLSFGTFGKAVLNTLPGMNQALTLGSDLQHLLGHTGSSADSAAKATDAVAKATKAYGDEVARVGAKAAEASPQHEALVTAQQHLAAIQGAVTGALDAGSAAADTQAEATKKQKAAADAVTKAEQAELNTLKRLNDLLLASANDTIALQQANLAVGDALQTYNEKLIAAKKAKEGDTQAARDLQSANLGVNSAILAGISAAEQNAAAKVDATSKSTGLTLQIEEETAKHKAAAAEIDVLKFSYPGLTAQIDAYARSLGLIPTQVDTRITINGGKTGSAGIIGGSYGLPGRAAGGPVGAGNAYIVGERGPELFVPRGSGSIVPNGGHGGITVYINNPTGNGQEIAKQLTVALNSGQGKSQLRQALGV